jgi:hypothetical protein
MNRRTINKEPQMSSVLALKLKILTSKHIFCLFSTIGEVCGSTCHEQTSTEFFSGGRRLMWPRCAVAEDPLWLSMASAIPKFEKYLYLPL